MQFEWINFNFGVCPQNSWNYKDNRAELIADIQSAYSAINMKLPKIRK